MKSNKYSKDEAGVETLWVMDFENNKSENHPKVIFHELVNDNYAETIQNSFYVDAPKNLENNASKSEPPPKNELETIQELCEDIEESCNKSIKNQNECQQRSDAINHQIKTLGNIIKKFNNILEKFKKKRKED
ncbi:MAG: hypothetical protein VX777_00640 [Chlamydiota bacterium]|nr:hypothetical protein [Chlamydiota bacterium]